MQHGFPSHLWSGLCKRWLAGSPTAIPGPIPQLEAHCLAVATRNFSLVPRVQSWSNRLGWVYTRKDLLGQNGLMFLPGIALLSSLLLYLGLLVYRDAQGMVLLAVS